MLNKKKHQLVMGQILKDIYTDISIASWLGFKGGTCAHFFYGLPRFSIDLDFDLLQSDGAPQKKIFEELQRILTNYGEIKDKHIKRFTIFMLLSYGDVDHNIKIEVNTHSLIFDAKEQYVLREYLGISMLVAKQDYLFTGKLAALTFRSPTAMRDIYDIYFFAKNNWDINNEVIKALTGKNTKECLADCIATIKNIKDSQIMQGLGELLTEKEKNWVKNYLKSEAIFLLKNYLAVL